MVQNSKLMQWVEATSRLTCPDKTVWWEGTESEYSSLVEAMVHSGVLLPLNQKSYPGCYLHRSNANDVARTEHLTFICSEKKEDAGPTNNWMSPADAKERIGKLFEGSMRGRTMYVIPYLMGPLGSPYSKVGVEITDSPYVVANMHIMTRTGTRALEHLGSSEDFVPGLHSLGDLSPDRRFIAHFPDEQLIWSVGSGYGGNALLGKKCFALRIASSMARKEGWLAEHMLIIGLEDPSGEVTYMAAAMPSASGKTNLAMLQSALSKQGYKVWTIGDDIAWLHIDEHGQLRAINPEAGFFGVAPNTSDHSNPNAMATVRKNSIFTNVGLTSSGEPWWEGIGYPPPEGMTDWKGNPWSPGGEKAAHPNSRFTAPAHQCPSMSPRWEDAAGVPISAFIFGSRRSRVVPVVFEATSWANGVYLGSSMGTETTAAATGAVGVVRRDPMAMLPFCGYNMADYFGHWLAMESRLKQKPKIFRVNWFRTDADGKFLWPGYGENVRILKWMVERIKGTGKAVETPIGLMPSIDALDLSGLQVDKGKISQALTFERDGWLKGLEEQAAFFNQFGDRMPRPIWEEHHAMVERLTKATV